MKFKSLLITGMLIPCVMAIVACGDGSDSNPLTNGSNGNFVGLKFPIVLDESLHKFSISEESRHDACVVDSGKYTFETMTDTHRLEREYGFRGDTLVIFYSDGDVRTYGQIFVGGKNGQIKNKWRMINCEYVQESNSLNCSNTSRLSSRLKNTITYYDFTQDTLFTSTTDLNGNAIDVYAPIEDEYDDYTRSSFMEEIFEIIVHTNEGIGLSGYVVSPWTAFWESEGFDAYVQKRNIVINSTDKTHVLFVIGGQNFEIEFTKAKRLQYNRGSYIEVGATLKSGNGVCVLDYMSDFKMTPEICKAENANLMNLSYTYDSNDSLLYYGSDNYHIGNTAEFRDCIINLVKNKNTEF